MKGLEPVVKELAAYPNERKWFEFKVNWFDPDEVGNTYQLCRTSAVMLGEKFGYLV